MCFTRLPYLVLALTLTDALSMLVNSEKWIFSKLSLSIRTLSPYIRAWHLTGVSMVPNARFLELLADIEPSPTTQGYAQSVHLSVRNHLRCHEEFKARWEQDFLAGSYARDTAIRPKITAD